MSLETTGIPTPEEAAAMLDAAFNGENLDETKVSGEPSTEPQTVDAPDAEDKSAPETDSKSEATPEANVDDEGEVENAVVLAKDGKHTIPYEKLVEARQAANQYRQRVSELEALVAQKDSGEQANSEIADNLIEQGIDPSVFGDFSEEDLAKGIAKVVNDLVAKQLEPIQKKIAMSEEELLFNQHMAAILASHPDLDSVLESSEFETWRNSKPAYIQSGIQEVLNSGTAKEVIDLMNDYKSSDSKVKSEPDVKHEVKTKVVDDPMRSLSDLPSSTTSSMGTEEKLREMNPVQLMETMSNWTPEQIEKYLNRNT